MDLADAVLAVDKIEGIERIRLGSLQPDLLDWELLKKLSLSKKLCPQFHLSLQSGSDTVLKRMNRHYTTELYSQVVANIHKLFENATITTDIIVGFPQESDEEFSSDKNLRGYSENYTPIIVKSSDETLKGQLLRVKITDCDDENAYAELI